MKTTKKLLAIFIAMITLFGCFSMCITASAAETTEKTINLVSKSTYGMYGGDYRTVNVSVPETSKVYMTVYAGSYTNGKFKITIEDSNNIVYAKKDMTFSKNTDEKDQRIYVDLKKGDYKIVIKNTGDNYAKIKYAVWEKLTKNYPTKSLTLNRKSVIMHDDDTLKLYATQTPYYTNDEIVWTSSNTKVVTVKDGKLTRKGLGTATVTATSGSKKATCKVTVNNVNVYVTDMKTVYLTKYVKNIPGYEGGTWTNNTNKKAGTLYKAGKFVPKDYDSTCLTYKTPEGKCFLLHLTVTPPVVITGAEEYSTSTTFGIKLNFKNYSNKTVSSVKVKFIEYNALGDVARSNYRYLSNVNVKPSGEAYLKCKVGIITVAYTAYIKEVKFTDGTVWKLQ